MGGKVFANGLEISGKAVQAQTIAIFPDVCFTPPESPATPPGVPIPYPSFGMGSDTENGTGNVFISGKTVNIKNKSDESKTTGTEAGAAAKKGIITSKNTGKKYFNSWSPDVKFEGEPVIRFSDLATHNHASPSGNTPPGPEVVTAAPSPPHDKCQLTTYKPNNCPSGTTPHHLVGDAQFRPAGQISVPKKSGVGTTKVDRPYYKGCDKLSHASGLCICLQGMVKTSTIPDEDITGIGLNPDSINKTKMGDRRLTSELLESTRQNVGRTKSMFPNWAGASPFSLTLGEHGRFHDQYDNLLEVKGLDNIPPNTVTLDQSAELAADLCDRMHGCDPKDIKAQILNHYQAMDIPPETRLRSGVGNSNNVGLQPAPGVQMGVIP
ncbi:MAG: DUF4150 domain-containing protein [Paracoccaceae bacterium]